MSLAEAALAIDAAYLGGLAEHQILDVVDPEAVVGAIAAVREEYPGYDARSCAPLIDWPRLRREGETVDEYRDRLAADAPAV